MLDRTDTAGDLRKKLAEAFDRWSKQGPVSLTKAELARQCQQLADRPCSPQAVSGWFKTGRMDKSWIPIVERVLGVDLGFNAAQAGTIAHGAPNWPFVRVQAEKLANLKQEDALLLEGALLLVATQLGLDISDDHTGHSKATKKGQLGGSSSSFPKLASGGEK